MSEEVMSQEEVKEIIKLLIDDMTIRKWNLSDTGCQITDEKTIEITIVGNQGE